MDDVASLHYDETPKARTLRYIAMGVVGLFVITVTIIAIVEGFSESNREGIALLGISCFMFSLTTFFMAWKIANGDLSDAARIPVYLQMIVCIFLGVAVLITAYSDYHPSDLNCYYDDNEFVSKKYGCWDPPQSSSGTSCFDQSSRCIYYISKDHYECGNVQTLTNGSYSWKQCSYYPPTQHPTPAPVPTTTTTPRPSPPPPGMLQNINNNNIPSTRQQIDETNKNNANLNEENEEIIEKTDDLNEQELKMHKYYYQWIEQNET